MRRQLPALVALITAIVWGVNFPFLKIGLAELSPLAFTFWRYLLMLALAWAVLGWQHRRSGMAVTVDRRRNDVQDGLVLRWRGASSRLSYLPSLWRADDRSSHRPRSARTRM